MALSPGPWVKPQYFDNNGLPAASYRLFFYDAGTSTKRDTYQDADQSSLNTNPVVLDSAGRANIFLLPTLYKIVYAAAGSDDPPSSPIWTVDDVGPSGGVDTSVDVSGTAGENLSLNEVCYLSDGSGALTAGRWYKADADQTYSSNGAVMLGIATAAITSGDTGSFRRNGRMTGLSGLTAGTTYYVSATAGAMTLTPPTNAIVIGKAESTTVLVLDANWGVAGAAVTGLVGTAAQTWSGVKTFNSQPQTYIGTATTVPATVGGQFSRDITPITLTGVQTNATIGTVAIPANFFNADGKALKIYHGSSTAWTGGDNKDMAWQVFQSVQLGTGVVFPTAVTAYTFTSAEITIVRIDSDSLDVAAWGGTSAGGPTLRTNSRVNGADFTAAWEVRLIVNIAGTSTITQTYLYAVAFG